MVLYGTTNYNKTKFIMVPLIKIYGTNIKYKKKNFVPIAFMLVPRNIL